MFWKIALAIHIIWLLVSTLIVVVAILGAVFLVNPDNEQDMCEIPEDII